MFTRIYDRMTHIVCYVYDDNDETMKCFDVNNERLKLIASGKNKKERKDEKQDSYDSDY